MRIGVLAVQGGVAPHAAAIRRLGHEPVLLRAPAHFVDLGGLVLPGGESTTQRKLVDRLELHGPLEELVASGIPVLATCAGLILAAQLGWLDVEVERNGWGRQVASGEQRDDADNLSMTFIRAPRITAVGKGVEVLATLAGEPVLVRQGSLVAATFHPELGDDDTIHAMMWNPDR